MKTIDSFPTLYYFYIISICNRRSTQNILEMLASNITQSGYRFFLYPLNNGTKKRKKKLIVQKEIYIGNWHFPTFKPSCVILYIIDTYTHTFKMFENFNIQHNKRKNNSASNSRDIFYFNFSYKVFQVTKPLTIYFFIFQEWNRYGCRLLYF